MQEFWKLHNEKISENTRINKEILRQLLLQRPRKRLTWYKFGAALRIFSPLLFIFLVLILKVQFQVSFHFYIGLILFVPVFCLTYFWDIRYYMKISEIRFSLPVLTLRKSFAELEKYRLKTTKIRYLLMPVAMAGFLMMIIRKVTIKPDLLTMLPLVLIVIVFFSSMFITIRYTILEKFRKLNQDIDEIEKLEK